MPEYFVRCDECHSEHSGRYWDIDRIIKQCDYCGGDCCPHCKSDEKENYHQDCLEKYLKESND